MAVASEGLVVVRENADGSLQWQEELVTPGAPGTQCAILANLDMASEVLNATAFKMTDSGDWIARVQGIEYNILPGVIPKTGHFVFIGLPLRPGGSGLGDPSNVRPTFAGAGDLTATVYASQVAITADFSGRGRLWSGRLTRPTATPRRVWFTGEGELTATLTKHRPRTRATRFRSAGRLTATVDEWLANQIAADLAGDGSLTATATAPRPVDPPVTGTMSWFEFNESSGTTAFSNPPGYTLTAQDPSTAWDGDDAVGHFVGVVGHGYRDTWSVKFVLHVAGATEGEIRLEGCGDALCGFRWSAGEVHAGLYDSETGLWVWDGGSTFPATYGASLEWVSNAATNTTILRDSNTQVSLPHATLRNFDDPADVLPDPTANTFRVLDLKYYGNVITRRKAKT